MGGSGAELPHARLRAASAREKLEILRKLRMTGFLRCAAVAATLNFLMRLPWVAGYSQFSVVARESVIKIDGDLPMETPVLFSCAVTTGVGTVVNTARVAAGTSVAVFGAGGVGPSAIMGAKAVGASPIIAIDRVISKLELATRCGATRGRGAHH